MGEFAMYRGQRIKIGTCEDMLYLRADQRHLITGYRFSELDRFRFPFPDEDGVEPGHFDRPDRGVEIPDYSLLAGEFQAHAKVQFSSGSGYLLSLPCPEQFGRDHVELDGGTQLPVGRNGFNAYPKVTMQREVDGMLCAIVACGACRSSWRIPTLGEARPIIEAFRADAAKDERFRFRNWSAPFLRAMADRIEAGYTVAAAA